MGFFLALHRSIVEPKFYNEIMGFSRSQVVIFFLKLLVFISFLSAIAQCYYFIYSDRGISLSIQNAFKGMEIKQGLLDPKGQTPIVPPTYVIMPALDQLFGFQNFFSSDKDSVIIIDTAKTRNYMLKIPAILMAREKVIFYFNKQTSFEIPYKTLLFGAENLSFTAEEIKRNLIKHKGAIFLSMFIAHIFQNTITLFFSIFFLAIAAFFFRMEKVSTFSKYLRAATYSISPMAVGSVLIAISGVKILWGWHILIFISTIVLFRGLVASSSNILGDDPGEK